MGLCWNRDYVAEIVTRGKWIAVHSSLSVLINSSDKLFIGFLFPGHTLGVYSIAAQLVEAVVTLTNRVLGHLGLPMFREVVHQGAEIVRRSYYQFRTPFEILAFFSAGYLLLAGDALISLLYDLRYADAGWMLSPRIVDFVPTFRRHS